MGRTKGEFDPPFLSYNQQLRSEEQEALRGGEASFHRNGDGSEASAVRVGTGRPIIRPSEPSLPESAPPPYRAEDNEPHYSEPRKMYPSITNPEAATGTPLGAVPRPRLLPGTSRCDGNNCVTCELLLEGSSFRSEMTGRGYKFVTPVTCRTSGVIYLVGRKRFYCIRIHTID